MPVLTRSRRKLIDSLYVSLLVLYVVAGMMTVPFHGDESSTIYMSRDWYTLTRNPIALGYRNPPPDPKAATNQQLRLVNGTVTWYMMGFAASMIGLTPDDINDQWLWGADWDYNYHNGHIPSDRLLVVSRLASTLLTMLSVAVVFAIGRRIGGRDLAWLASFIYATMPAVMINGRRAMFEGAFLLVIGLVILAGLAVARQYATKHGVKRWLLLGIVSGVAVATKHTALITVIPVWGALLFIGRCDLWRTIRYSLLALIAAGMVFLALTPVWWSAPLEVPREVLRLRQELLNGQAAYFGSYTNALDRVGALVQQPFGGPQYYEDQHGWPQWIGEQIAAYETGGPFVVGIAWGRFAIPFLLVGFVALVIPPIPLPLRRRSGEYTFGKPLPLYGGGVWGGGSPKIVLLTVVWFTPLALLILTPMAWQRYYLPLAPIWAVLFALGALTLWRFIRSRNAR